MEGRGRATSSKVLLRSRPRLDFRNFRVFLPSSSSAMPAPSLLSRGPRVSSLPLAAAHRRRYRALTCHASNNPPPACGLGSPQLLEECGEIDWRSPLASSSAETSTSTSSGSSSSDSLPIVALGKFDAMHRGHRSLAAAAAQMKLLGGKESSSSSSSSSSPVLQPWLLSFSGMAQVLGWEPRRPLVAPCDRARVLGSWAPACGGVAPRQRIVPFAAVRSMEPEEFVEALTEGLGARGVVVGEGHRFGKNASGDTALLTRLCEKRGVAVRVVSLVRSFTKDVDGVGDCGGDVVSSSAARDALAAGRVAAAAALLGRRYRLVAMVSASDWATATEKNSTALVIQDSSFLNQPPRGGQAYSAAATVAPAEARPVGASGVVDLRDVDVVFSGSSSGAPCAQILLPPGSQWPRLPGNGKGGVRLTLDF